MENQVKNLAVFVSGSGTNLENLALSIQKGKLKGCRIALVVSDQPEAYALKRAERFGLETLAASRADYHSREEFESVVIRALENAKIDFIVLAGFMRILSPAFIKKFRGRVINVHPALLPAFPGAHAIRDAWEAKAKETGVTVHFVDEGIDTGPIVLQEPVRVLPEDTLESLEKKIHAVEYELYPQAIQFLVNGRLRVSGSKVEISKV